MKKNVTAYVYENYDISRERNVENLCYAVKRCIHAVRDIWDWALLKMVFTSSQTEQNQL